MFGLGMAPGATSGSGTGLSPASDPDEPVRRLELRRNDAGRAVGCDPLDLDGLQRGVDGLAEPLRDAGRVTGDLQAVERDATGGAVARVQVVRHLPLDEERELRVGLQPPDAELLPEELGAVGAVAVAVDGLTAEARLVRPDVVDRDHPAQP